MTENLILWNAKKIELLVSPIIQFDLTKSANAPAHKDILFNPSKIGTLFEIYIIQ